MGILPQIEVVIEIRLAVVLRQPQVVVGQLPQVVAQIAQALIEIDRRTQSGLLDFLTEGGGALGQGLVVQAVGAGPASRGDGLPVEGDGVADLVPLQGVDDIGGFRLGLLRGDGLGKK